MKIRLNNKITLKYSKNLTQINVIQTHHTMYTGSKRDTQLI